MSWSPNYNVHYSADPVMELIRAYETLASDNDTDTNCSAAEIQPQLLLNQVRSVYLVTYSQANKCEFPYARILCEGFS